MHQGRPGKPRVHQAPWLLRNFCIRWRRPRVDSRLVGSRARGSVARPSDGSGLLRTGVGMATVRRPMALALQIRACFVHVVHVSLRIRAWRVLGDDVPRVDQTREIAEDTETDVDEGVA